MFTFLIALFGALSIYSYFSFKHFFVGNSTTFWAYTMVYWLLVIFVLYSFSKVIQVVESGSIFRSKSANIFIGIVITALATQVTLGSLLLLQDLGRLIAGLWKFTANAFTENYSNTKVIPGRRDFLTVAAAGVAAIPFFGMLYGITLGKYNYTVERLKLAFGDLPKSFNGLRVVQISDIHAGSFDSKDRVARGIEMINAEKPDLILFTGDLVNSNKDEIDPYIDLFSQLKAKYGKYAVLGNHDYYGEYRLDESEKKPYRANFHSKFSDMGFKLLNNSSEYIEIEGERIAIVGVENWGAGRWFPKKGDLTKALKKSDDSNFKILMSHDPTHWDEHVIPNDMKIHLTLSGHTHGMQFGINIPGFKWSPVQYRYNRWMGLYEEEGQYLYVNRGFGFLGFPGRVGMWPEITVIDLESVS